MTAPLVVNFHMPIDAQDREVLAELQNMLVELIDLALIGKQAHWNVEGPHFRSLHVELDELVDTWRTLGDEVAERAVTPRWRSRRPGRDSRELCSSRAAPDRPSQGLRRRQGSRRPSH